MPLVVECPSCGRKLKVPDELMGKSVRCADCANTFVAEKPRSADPPPAPVRVRDDEYEDDRPRRSRRRDSFAEQHRGGMILAFGIISIVVGGVGLVTGILAWVWGRADLKKMDAGQMDPEGRNITQIGYILGIIGTIIHALGLVFVCLYFIVVIVIMGVVIGTAANMPTSKTPFTPVPVKPGTTKKKAELRLPAGPRRVDYLPARMC
ncbi:MAG: hypothetical protein ACJ8F7_07405 [Gemmataceae bacterium]